MKGYKAFNKDWTCRNKQYRVGEIFEEDVSLIPCVSGMHFCEQLQDIFKFYDFDPDKTVVAEVEAIGDVTTDDDIKFCTNKLRIVRELSWDEVQKGCIIGERNTGDCNAGNENTGNNNGGNRNTGDCNTGSWNSGCHNAGYWNTGCWNTGNWNTGDKNTGNCNTGNWNIGDCNFGKCNIGNCNIGNCNTGDYNTGNCNTGNKNVGDWNKSSFNNGCFMTIEPKITMFNKMSDWTLRDWWSSKAYLLLIQIPKTVVEWVSTRSMTDEEKQQHPEYKTTGGYLKVLDKSCCAQLWWDKLCQEDRNVILALPNFDSAIFKECTGIDVNKEV